MARQRAAPLFAMHSRATSSVANVGDPHATAAGTGSSWRYWVTHACLFTMALGVRFAYVLESRALPFFDSLVNDAASYDSWARQIAGGDLLGADIFYQAPLYPYFLAAVYSAIGRDLLLVRLIQALIGAAGCTALALAGGRFFDRRTGLIAGLMLAVYPPAIFFDGLIQKAVLDGFCGAVLLFLLARAQSRPRKRTFTGVGLTLGLFCLSRENVLLVIPLVGLWTWFRFSREPLRARMTWIGALVAGILAILAPVAMRNRYVGREWTLTTCQAGVNFWIGNHTGASGTYAPLRIGRGDARYERSDAMAFATRSLGREASPAEASADWFERAAREIVVSPREWLGLLGRKFALALNWYEVPDTEDIYFYEGFCKSIRWLGRLWHFGVLLPLAAFGAVVSWGRRRDLCVLYILFASVLMSVVLFYVFGRYRYPLVPPLILFAARGASSLVGLPKWPPGALRFSLAAVVVSCAGLVGNWPIQPRHSALASSRHNAGVAFAQRGRYSDALASFDEASRILPGYFSAEISRGATLQKMGRHDEAEAAFGRAAALAPDEPAPPTFLGMAALLRGDPDAAEGHFERVLAVWPDHPEALNGLGHVLLWRHEEARALALIRRAAELLPLDVRLSRDLALLLCALPDESLRDGPSALNIAQRLARQTAGEDAESLDVLGMAMAECGRFAEAREVTLRAIEVARAAEREDLVRVIRPRLQLYASGRPARFGRW